MRLAILITISILLTAVTGRVNAQDPIWPHEGSDITPDPNVVYGVLENGLRYAVLENDTPKGDAYVRFQIGAGSLQETDDQRGLAHFLEHMAFNGSTNIPEGELVPLLERLGLAFGADTNASTGFDRTIYQLDLPAISDEYIDTALMLMRETASNLTLDPAAIDRERGVILSERRARNSPQLRTFEASSKFIAPGSQLSDRLPIGVPEVIETATREQFLAFYHGYYRPENALIAVVGDIDAQAIIEKIKARFGDWQGVGEPGPALDAYTPPPPASPADIAGGFSEPEIPTQVSLQVVKPWVQKPDTQAQRKQDFIRSVGLSILTRRLATLARSEDAVFVQGAASYQTLPQTAELASLAIISEADKWPEGLAVAEQELRKILQFGVTDGEIREQLANVDAALRAQAAGQDTRPSDGLVNAIIGAAHNNRVFSTPQAAYDRFLAFKDEITSDAVTQSLRQTWSGAPPKIFLATSDAPEDFTQALIQVLQQSAQTPIEAPEEFEDVAFAYTSFGEPGTIADQSLIEDFDITTIRFANNVRLNLKPTEFEKDRIRVSLRFGNGTLDTTPDQAGLTALASLAFIGGGLQAHSQDELQRVLAGRNVGAQLAVGDNGFSFSSVTTPEDFAFQMQLWAAFFVAPGYRPEGYAQYRRFISTVYDTLDGTPAQVASVQVPGIIRSDTRFGLPSREKLEGYTLENLKALMAEPLTQDAIEIAVVGDFDIEAVIQAVAATFGALPTREALPDEETESRALVSFPKPGRAELTHAGEADQSLVQIYWPTDDDEDVVRTRGLNVLADIFRLRMTDRIREELGATYSGQSGSVSSEIFPDYGYLVVATEVDVKDITAIEGVLKDIAGNLAKDGVTEDELQRARQPILEDIKANQQDNGYWLNVASDAQTDPEDLDRLRRQVADYEGITRRQLRRLARRYLKEDKAFVITIVPEQN